MKYGFKELFFLVSPLAAWLEEKAFSLLSPAATTVKPIRTWKYAQLSIFYSKGLFAHWKVFFLFLAQHILISKLI